MQIYYFWNRFIWIVYCKFKVLKFLKHIQRKQVLTCFGASTFQDLLVWSLIHECWVDPGTLVEFLETVFLEVVSWIRWSYWWLRLNAAPPWLFIAFFPLRRIQMDSLIHLGYLSSSLWRIFAPSQSITWFVAATWSEIADLCWSDTEGILVDLVWILSAILSTSCWCSFKRVFRSHIWSRAT